MFHETIVGGVEPWFRRRHYIREAFTGLNEDIWRDERPECLQLFKP